MLPNEPVRPAREGQSIRRATTVYLTMIVVFVAGLWIVMAIGGGLTAPEDLSGRWVAVPPPDAGPWPAVTVAQSGKFFELAFDNGPAEVDLTMVGRTDDGRLSLARGKWHVTVDGRAGQPVRTFRVDGPAVAGTFTGRRAAPATAPADGEAK